MTLLEGKNIIVVSNEPWGDTWYSKHNYAYELAKRNTVFFIDPCERWTVSNLRGTGMRLKEVGKNLFVIRYRNILPATPGFLYRWNNRIVSRRLKKFLRDRDIANFIFWSFDPYRLSDPAMAGAETAIYHAVDKYDLKPRGERELCEKADVIFTVSESFRETYSRFGTPVHVLPHGISSEEFRSDPAFVLPAGWQDYGLYIGTIDTRLDFDLLERAIQRFSGQTFVFLGKINLPEGNEAAKRIFTDHLYKNVIAPGPVHFKQLKNYIAQAKFCLAFMNKQHNGNQVSHHKIFQYLAFGKPVFSCRFSEYAAKENLFYMDDNDDALLGKLGHFLAAGESIETSVQRIAYAQEHTFEFILQKAAQLI